MSMFHQFHELWVAAGPFSVLGSVLVALIVLLFAWLALKDCPFGWVEARARAGRGFVNVSHRFESECSVVDVLSYRVHRGKLVVHYRVTNRSDGFCGFGANQLRAFQHGIAIDRSGPEADYLRGWERNVTLLPGASVTLNQMFLLCDKSPVTVVANYCEYLDGEPFVLQVSHKQGHGREGK